MSAELPLWKRALAAAQLVEFQTPPPDQQATSPAAPFTPATPIVPIPAGIAPAAAANDELVQTLMRVALARRTTFSSLVEAAEKLRDILPDDAQRIKAAARMTGTTTPDAITTAVNGHIQDVSVEQGKFDREMADMKAVKVDQPLQQAASLESSITAEQAEIVRLTQSITEKTAAAASLKAQAGSAEAEIQTLKAQFGASMTRVVESLNGLRDSILSALK